MIRFTGRPPTIDPAGRGYLNLRWDRLAGYAPSPRLPRARALRRVRPFRLEPSRPLWRRILEALHVVLAP